jgi:hypothetical protein
LHLEHVAFCLPQSPNLSRDPKLGLGGGQPLLQRIPLSTRIRGATLLCLLHRLSERSLS